jgi:predicted MFS family arabinose efflux permease
MNALFRLYRDSYSGLPRATWLLSLSAFINRSGSMVVPFLTVYLGERWGFTVGEAGAFVSIYGLGSIVGSLIGGRLADRIGAVQIQILALAGAGLWFWFLAAVDSLAVLAPGLLVLGVINDMFRPGNMSAVTGSSAPHLRSKALALNRLMLNAGWAIGPTVGGFLSRQSFAFLFLADGTTCMLAAIYLYMHRGELVQSLATVAAAEGSSTAPRTQQGAQLSPWRDRVFLTFLGLALLALLAFMQYFTTETRYLRDVFHYSKPQIGWLLAINPVLITLLEMPLVHALRRRRALPIVALGCALIGLGLALLVFRLGLPMVVLSLVVLTFGEMFEAPFLGAFVSSWAPAGRRGAYLGAYGSTFSIAFVAAPLFGGIVYDSFGPETLWLGCGTAGLIAAMGFLVAQRVLAARA